MTTLFAPQLAAGSRCGYVDDDSGLGAGFGSIVRRAVAPPAGTTPPPPPPVAPPPPPPPPRAPGFGAIVQRASGTAPALPTPPARSTYTPPARALKREFNGDPSSLASDEIVARTSSGRFVVTAPSPGPGSGSPFGGTWQADAATFMARLNEQVAIAYPGERISELLGRLRPNDTVRAIGTAAAIATPILAVVAPYIAPATAMVAAATASQGSGGNMARNALTAGIGTALTSGASGMNFAQGNSFGNLASGLANTFGASSGWASLIGNAAGIASSLFGGGGGSNVPAIAPPIVPTPEPRIEVTSRDGVLQPTAPSNNLPLILGGLAIVALIAASGGRRR